MARVTIEDCLDNVENRFALVHLAVRRVLQLRSGANTFVNAPKNKEVVLALREIAANKVTPQNIRQFDETKSLPDPVAQEKEEVTRTEVKEILEAATQFDAAVEYEEQEQFIDQDEE
jgi:DNA-directed RNA polymerase subunit omega